MQQEMTFQLTKENYHSKEADALFMSVSQFKSGQECEAATFAGIEGDYVRPESPALTLGSYTHAAFESTEAFAQFVEDNQLVIFNNKGNKYASYQQADEMIECLKNDRLAMFALTGEKEVIMTGEIGGVQWKIRIDNLNLERGYFSDLKTTKSLYDRFWSEKYGSKYVSFVHHYGYILQMAVYQEIIRQNTGQLLEPYIVAVTKETPPDKEIITFDQDDLNFELEYVVAALPSVLEAKRKQRERERCGKCAFCRGTKQLKSPVNVNYLLD